MSENARRFYKPARRPRPPKQKRTKPELTPDHVGRAHKILRRELEIRGYIPGHNKKDAAWHIHVTGDDRRILGPRHRQVNAIMRALWECEEGGILRHDGFGYRKCGRQVKSAG